MNIKLLLIVILLGISFLPESSASIINEHSLESEVAGTYSVAEQLFNQVPEGAEFYLVRHGESIANTLSKKEKKKLKNDPEGPGNLDKLTKKGKEQAKAAGLRLKYILGNKNVGAVFVSPLKRTHETAAEIGKAFENFPSPLTIDSLKEESSETLENSIQRDENGHKIRVCSRGQYTGEAAQGIGEIFTKYIKKHDPKKATLVVAHKGTILSLSCLALHKPEDADNCGIYHFKKANGKWLIKTLF